MKNFSHNKASNNISFFKYTREPGFLSYYEMCEKVQKDWTREWNEEQKIPFAHNNFHWVSYEDLQSIVIKVTKKPS